MPNSYIILNETYPLQTSRYIDKEPSGTYSYSDSSFIGQFSYIISLLKIAAAKTFTII